MTSMTPKPAGDALRAARRSVTLLFFINGALFASWVSRIPALQSKLGLSHGMLGLALLGMAAGALVAMPLAGWFASRIGTARVCQITACGYALALPFVAFAPNAFTFMAALAAFGAAHGGLDVGMNAQAVVVEKTYGRNIMASFHALFSLGGLAGATLGGGMATVGSIPQTHFAIMASLALSCCGFYIFSRLLRGDQMPGAGTPIGRTAHKRSNNKHLFVLGVVAFCVMIGEGAMADWSAVYLRQVGGAAEGVAAAGYAAFSIAMAVGRFTGDRLSTGIGAVNMVRFSGIISAAGLTLALLDSRPVAALIGFAAVGAGFATVVPQVFSAAGRTSGKGSGPAVATVTTMGYLGFLIGPPAIGLLAELCGLRMALGVIVASSALLIVLAPSVGNGAPALSQEDENALATAS